MKYLISSLVFIRLVIGASEFVNDLRNTIPPYVMVAVIIRKLKSPSGICFKA